MKKSLEEIELEVGKDVIEIWRTLGRGSYTLEAGTLPKSFTKDFYISQKVYEFYSLWKIEQKRQYAERVRNRP